jgi:hypothetical protein
VVERADSRRVPRQRVAVKSGPKASCRDVEHGLQLGLEHTGGFENLDPRRHPHRASEQLTLIDSDAGEIICLSLQPPREPGVLVITARRAKLRAASGGGRGQTRLEQPPACGRESGERRAQSDHLLPADLYAAPFQLPDHCGGRRLIEAE